VCVLAHVLSSAVDTVRC